MCQGLRLPRAGDEVPSEDKNCVQLTSLWYPIESLTIKYAITVMGIIILA